MKLLAVKVKKNRNLVFAFNDDAERNAFEFLWSQICLNPDDAEYARGEARKKRKTRKTKAKGGK